jgi:plastocyanin
MMRGRIALAATVASVLAACGGDDPAAGRSPSCLEDPAGTSAIEVRGTDAFAFEPADVQAPVGDVTITLVNDGTLPHALVINGTTLRLDARKEGDTCTGIVTLPAGRHEFWCDVPGHRQAGMEGTLTIE